MPESRTSSQPRTRTSSPLRPCPRQVRARAPPTARLSSWRLRLWGRGPGLRARRSTQCPRLDSHTIGSMHFTLRVRRSSPATRSCAGCLAGTRHSAISSVALYSARISSSQKQPLGTAEAVASASDAPAQNATRLPPPSREPWLSASSLRAKPSLCSWLWIASPPCSPGSEASARSHASTKGRASNRRAPRATGCERDSVRRPAAGAVVWAMAVEMNTSGSLQEGRMEQWGAAREPAAAQSPQF